MKTYICSFNFIFLENAYLPMQLYVKISFWGMSMRIWLFLKKIFLTSVLFIIDFDTTIYFPDESM